MFVSLLTARRRARSDAPHHLISPLRLGKEADFLHRQRSGDVPRQGGQSSARRGRGGMFASLLTARRRARSDAPYHLISPLRLGKEANFLHRQRSGDVPKAGRAVLCPPRAWWDVRIFIDRPTARAERRALPFRGQSKLDTVSTLTYCDNHETPDAVNSAGFGELGGCTYAKDQVHNDCWCVCCSCDRPPRIAPQ